MKIEKALLSGSTPLLVLSLLKDGDKYGYQMVTELAKRSEDTFQLKEGTLYPLLHTLEKQGYVTSYPMTPEQGRERKYYRLTDSGLRQLEHKEQEWRLFSEFPSTANEAFQSTGRRVFKISYVKNIRECCVPPAWIGDIVSCEKYDEATGFHPTNRYAPNYGLSLLRSYAYFGKEYLPTTHIY